METTPQIPPVPLLSFYVKILPDTPENRAAVEQLRYRMLAAVRDCDQYLYGDRFRTIPDKEQRRMKKRRYKDSF